MNPAHSFKKMALGNFNRFQLKLNQIVSIITIPEYLWSIDSASLYMYILYTSVNVAKFFLFSDCYYLQLYQAITSYYFIVGWG